MFGGAPHGNFINTLLPTKWGALAEFTRGKLSKNRYIKKLPYFLNT
ncbi:hypothetical protein QU96_0038 [Acinetobacter baumannii]|nr:hypothetical protein QU96_0038 [Acinetobacter baumannii]